MDNNPNIYINAIFILISVSIFAYLYVIQNLRNKKYTITSLRYFNLYFILGVIGWVAYWLERLNLISSDLTPNVLFYVIVSVLLLLAVAETVGRKLPVKLIYAIHALLIVGVFFLDTNLRLLLFVGLYNLAVYPIISYLSFRRAYTNKNIGNGMVGAATLQIVALTPLILYSALVSKNFDFGLGVVFTSSSVGFVLVGIGFLTSLLVEEHNKLAELTLKDPLTGLFNRRGLEQALQISISQVRRNEDCISAIMLDIDHFKNINDTYGHDCGDYVLRIFANKLVQDARSSDASCRLGGEEFVIVLPGTTSVNASRLAERLRQSFEEMVIDYEDQRIRLTSSFGIATHCGQVDIDYLLKDADKALYEAKSQGRNRVCLANN